jgi:hypothetical protein
MTTSDWNDWLRLSDAAERLQRWDAGEPPSSIYHCDDPIEAANNDAWDLAREYRKRLAAEPPPVNDELKAAGDRFTNRGTSYNALGADMIEIPTALFCDMKYLSEQLAKRLSADEQKSREDAEPITEEWLRSDEWEFQGVYWHHSIPRKRELLLSQAWEHSDVLLKNNASPQFVSCGRFTTRGQLRKLLEALKGGDA